MIRFNETICRDLNTAAKREWLETNGLGGFASSTVSGMNTRRYHGLLVAATKPPVGRLVLLSKVEETLIIDGRRFELSANRYPGVVHPQGYQYLKEFRQDPFPVFVYQVEDVELEKSIFMVHGENTTVVQYAVRGAGAAQCLLELRPLIAFRDYHNTTHANEALNPAYKAAPGSLKFTPYAGLPPSLFLEHDDAAVRPTGDWYRSFEYDVERDRGLDFQEDLFNPCVLVFDLNRNERPAWLASTEEHSSSTANSLRQREIERRQALFQSAPVDDGFVRSLVVAADQFIVQRGKESTVVAGYHWFSDWGRDTMIALPGLALSTDLPDVARSILQAFANHVDRGMLPNRFPDAGEAPEYNTVDATLWFFEAVGALIEKTGDSEIVRESLYPVLADIISWHERGTRYGIRVDSDGLLRAGEPGVQLTWMDAKVGDSVVTPRQGKPVEIQALWYNALRVTQGLAEKYGYSDRGRYAEMAERAQSAFAPLFWNESQGCLFDVVDGAHRDNAIRPNQIFAVSLTHQMLPLGKARSVVQVVERQLLTPYGLRSLAPSDPAYRGRYDGSPYSRDSAYHQGTVWPWLLGPFVRAYLRVNNHSQKARKQAEIWLGGLRTYMEDEGCGQIPEVFDGDAPHRPGGCMAQAWSVAELLRTCVDDIYVCSRARSTRTRVMAASSRR